MDAINEILSREVAELLGRASGPFHFRLVIQPIVASLLAVRAGMKDARAGRPAFFWTILSNPETRRQLIESGWKDISKIVIVAIVLDTVYQLIVFRAFYVVQALIVVAVVALLPYVLLRGPVNRIAQGFLKSE